MAKETTHAPLRIQERCFTDKPTDFLIYEDPEDEKAVVEKKVFAVATTEANANMIAASPEAFAALRWLGAFMLTAADGG